MKIYMRNLADATYTVHASAIASELALLSASAQFGSAIYTVHASAIANGVCIALGFCVYLQALT